FAQELLSTFSTALGEVALQPSTGGVFTVNIAYEGEDDRGIKTTVHKRLWDRKVDGGFPETKELKRRVRDVVWPGKGLGHVDRDYSKKNHGEGKEGEESKVAKEEEKEEQEQGPKVKKDGNVDEGGKACKVDGEGSNNCEDCD
ncbi:Rdx family-domain-containing protein, partial [Cladorrhinum samala]